jgi:hypothetical protein
MGVVILNVVRVSVVILNVVIPSVGVPWERVVRGKVVCDPR